MRKAVYMALILSVALNLLLVAAIANQGFKFPKAEALKDIKNPGTYGPPESETIEGDATISAKDVTLQNTLITGNLYLTPGVEGGTVELRQVEVRGELVITGGDFSLNLADCTLAKISVQEAGAVRILATGSTRVADVLAAAAGTLEESLGEGAPGFINVQISTSQEVVLAGDFEKILLRDGEGRVQFKKGTAVSIELLESAQESRLSFTEEVQVENLEICAMASLTGRGRVGAVDLNAPGLVVLEGEIGEVYCRAEGIFLELQGGSIQSLLVPELEHATSIALAEETRVEEMELKGRTGVTGKGTIGTVAISHDGVTLDQKPDKVIIPPNLVAMVAGEEYQGKPEPEPEPPVKPEPPKPVVTIKKIAKVDLLMVGKTASRVVAAEPGGTALTVTSSNTKVAAVSLSGNSVIVTGKGSGKATITIKGTKSGHTSGTATFEVTVKGPMDVKSFKVVEGLSLGKKLVQVVLYADNPAPYKVTVAGVKLAYEPDGGYFYGEVLEADAKQGNVKVSQ